MLNDWIRGSYRYLTTKTVAKSQISGSTSVTLSSSATANPIALRSGAALIVLSSSADIQDAQPTPNGAAKPIHSIRLDYGYTRLDPPAAWFFETAEIDGSSTVTLDAFGLLTSQGQLAGSETVTFSSSTDLDGTTALSASQSVTFSSDATLINTSGDLSGNASVTFSPVGIIRADGVMGGSADISLSATARIASDNRGIAIPLLAGFQVYTTSQAAAYLSTSYYAARMTLVGSTDVTLSSSADLTEANEGAIVGAAQVAFSADLELEATGRLGGLAGIVFDSDATVTNAAASPLTASESITFTVSPGLTGDGELVGAESITFSSVSRLTSGAISGSSTITFSEDATARRTVKASTTTPITFSASADILGLAGEAIVGSSTINITASGEPLFGGGTLVGISATGAISRIVDLSVTRQRNRRSRGKRRNSMVRRKKVA